MSDNETLKPSADQDSLLTETSSSNQEDTVKDMPKTDTCNVIASNENQNVSVQDVELEVSRCTEDETVEVPTKEITVPVVENVQIVGETTSESVQTKMENHLSFEIIENEHSVVPEIRQQISIGAGDICIVKQDESVDVSKFEKATDEIAPRSDKSPAENDKNTTESEPTISILKKEVQKALEERDAYQKKFEMTEKKLAALQSSYDALMKGDGDDAMLRRMVDQLKGKLIQTSLQLEDRIRIASNQEKQISALNNQVASLKEVESLTRSLLQIRNMEVKHLQVEVDDMEVRITEERERYNTMINKMDSAVKLNADLKKEYETQLCLFRDLREKYEEKVSLLSEEKRALEANAQSVPK
ncbi:hypothetical protein WH47_03727 [Habropoda laboriosa]|uniref:Tropomyosin n=1 Tax=Habropoda laboriosa TaxID=597456 RepID=A0A0L7QVU2_9HYME|nr:hypothetical protein WH47_03727 [Habropoda laboriosa]